MLNGLASLPMVCEAGMEDRESLAAATGGTGPYELTEAVPGEQYTYQIRDGYTWGPNGATTAEKGMPATVVMKIVANEGTRANLILSGDLNAAQVLGPDVDRLDKAGLFAAETPVLLGEQWYNHADGHATSDPAVRMALTQALDLAELQSVLTADKGTPATTLAVLEPVACPGDSVSGALPAQDVEAAKAALSGVPELTFLYDSSAGSLGRRGGRARRAAVGGRGCRGHGKGPGPDRGRAGHLRHRRLGHRVDPAEREQPRPAGAVPVRARPR